MLKLRRTLRSTLPVAPVACVVAVALLAAGGVGLAPTADARDSRGGAAANDVHTINVALPDGAVARVTYQGKVAPQVALVPVGVAGDVFAPMAVGQAVPGDPFAADPLFAALERQQVEMVRQMNAMRQEALRQAAMVQGAAQATAAGAPGMVRVGSLPPGASFRYSFTSISNGAHGCTQTVEWRSDGSGKEPQVIRAASGDCDAAPGSGKARGLTPTSGTGRAEGSQAKPVPVAPAGSAPVAPVVGGSNT